MKLMMALIVWVVIATSLCMNAVASTSSARDFQNIAYQATGILYGQNESGDMTMRCTAMAYAKLIDGYLFVTASHCVSKQDIQRAGVPQDKVVLDEAAFFITMDNAGEKKFIPAQVIAAGFQRMGDDFAVLRVKTKDVFTVVPLGDNKLLGMGDSVLTISSPEGLGKQLMKGYVSMPVLDRPVKEDSINWQNAMVLQIASGPGASGSSVLSVDQQAIVAILVGGVEEQNVIAIPISRFKVFSDLINSRTYPYVPKIDIPVDAPILPVK